MCKEVHIGFICTGMIVRLKRKQGGGVRAILTWAILLLLLPRFPPQPAIVHMCMCKFICGSLFMSRMFILAAEMSARGCMHGCMVPLHHAYPVLGSLDLVINATALCWLTAAVCTACTHAHATYISCIADVSACSGFDCWACEDK